MRRCTRTQSCVSPFGILPVRAPSRLNLRGSPYKVSLTMLSCVHRYDRESAIFWHRISAQYPACPLISVLCATFLASTHCYVGHCNTLQHTATRSHSAGIVEMEHAVSHCNTLHIYVQHTAIHCNTLQHTAAHCNTLQHTATHCNTL